MHHPDRSRLAAVALAAALALAGCGGGGGGTPSTSGTPVSASGVSPAARAALPAHVSPGDLRRDSGGCYFYRVGSASLGYDVPLIGAGGDPVCA